MKTNNFLNAFLGISFLVSGSSWAGVGSSGGGLALVCRDSNHDVTKAQMVDVLEAKSYRLTIPTDTNAKDEMGLIEEALANVKWSPQEINYAKSLLSRISELFNNENSVHYDGKRKILAPTNDYGTLHIIEQDEGCNFEQVGHEDNGKLYINDAIYNHFDILNRAAFKLHEVVYETQRNALSALTSENSRHMVALMLAHRFRERQFLDFCIPSGGITYPLNQISPGVDFDIYDETGWAGWIMIGKKISTGTDGGSSNYEIYFQNTHNSGQLTFSCDVLSELMGCTNTANAPNQISTLLLDAHGGLKTESADHNTVTHYFWKPSTKSYTN